MIRSLLMLSFLSLIFLITSCGYTPVSSEEQGTSIDCVIHESDGFDGRFYPDLQRACLEQGVLLGSANSEYTLHIELNKDSIEQIGYRYDVDPNTQAITNRLIANEERRRVAATIWVEKSGTIVFGPKEVEGFAQYDFVDPDAVNDVSFIDSSGDRVSSLDYSFGQLDAMEGARRVSYGVASKSLAGKIALLIANSALR